MGRDARRGDAGTRAHWAVIINGNSRQNFRFFARHLMRTDQNQRVEIKEMRGVFGSSLLEALREMDAVASGSRTENFMYHANLNPGGDEQLTEQQWQDAVDRLERNLGLEGHARVVVEHEKDGRTHQHVIWNRIDPDTMTAASDSFNYRRHEQTAREIEEAFGLAHVDSVLVKDRDTPRPERRPKDYETFRAQTTKIDPKAVQAELTALWQEADSGLAFKAALEEAGYILARGDRRDFVVIDPAGSDHSITRRTGAKAAEVRSRLVDVDREALPSVAEARALARGAADAAGDAELPNTSHAAPEAPAAPPAPQEAAQHDTSAQQPSASAAPLDGQERAELAYLAPEPQLTDAIARDLAERFGESEQPGARMPQGEPEEPGGRPESTADSAAARDAPPFNGAEPPRASPWGQRWRDVAGNAWERFRAFWGEQRGAAAEEGTWQRLVLDAHRTVSDYLKRDGRDLFSDLTATVKDILAHGPHPSHGPKPAAESVGSDGKTWSERVQEKARSYFRSEDGAGVNPFDAFEEYAREWLSENATADSVESAELTVEPDIPEPGADVPEWDGPDLG